MMVKVRAQKKMRLNINKGNFFAIFGVPIALIIICFVLSLTTKTFLSVENIFNILRQISIIAIAGLGTTIILISGSIDISVSAVMALGGLTTIVSIVQYNIFSPIAVIIALFFCCFVGLINGAIVTKIHIPAFIATLGTMQIVRGLLFIYTKGESIAGEVPDSFVLIGRGYLGLIPYPVIIMFFLYIIFYLILNKTIFGLHIYAIGNNEKASKLVGINITKTRIIAFIIGGLTAAIAGILLAARLKSGQANAATGLEFDILTAVILGGTSIYGGKGNILRTLLGALLIGVINNGMTLLNVSAFYQMFASGIILILALTLDRIKAKL